MGLALIRRSAGKQKTTTRDAHSRRQEGSAPGPNDDYAGAFARVRLVRAWIGAAAAMVALGYAFSTLLDRILLP
jgi:hypothetical protein